MKPYYKTDIERIYADIFNYTYHCYQEGDLRRALLGIEAASKWAYNLNLFYRDDDLEKIIADIAKRKIDKELRYKPIDNRCVLIDSFLLDNRGLSQQYLRAMMACRMQILIVHTTSDENIGKNTKAEIEAYDKADFISFPKGMDKIKEAQLIVKEIVDFAPKHIFLHLTPWDVVALMASSCIKDSFIYNINLTDHAFWMGASFIDYNIEFRPYGFTVSMEKRGLLQEQLLALPFYPVIPNFSVFEGFPQLPDDVVKVFTGGALYKMLGKNDIFFHILERLLEISPRIVVLVAGFKNSTIFDNKLQTIRGHNRVFQIGIRKDIDAVFDNCDIFLETYPTSGGLMAQYAAIHSKPIISFREIKDVESSVEEMIYKKCHFKSYTNLEEMAVYAERLINDVPFRQHEGEILKESMMTSSLFNDEFHKIVKFHMPIKGWEKDTIDYNAFFERYLELENSQHNGTIAIIKVLKWSIITSIKSCRWNIIKLFFLMIINKIKVI